jgi:DNA transformation protein
MRVSDDYIAYVRDLLRAFEPLTTRRMFGGVGVYSGERFFALLADDQLYLKADDGNRPDFEREGLAPFSYTRKDGRPATMSYYPPPAAAQDNPEALRPWVEGALAAAGRAAK